MHVYTNGSLFLLECCLCQCVYLHCNNGSWPTTFTYIYALPTMIWFRVSYSNLVLNSVSLFPSLPPAVIDCTSILAVGTFHPSLADGQPDPVATHCQGCTRPFGPLVVVPARLHVVSASATTGAHPTAQPGHAPLLRSSTPPSPSALRSSAMSTSLADARPHPTSKVLAPPCVVFPSSSDRQRGTTSSPPILLRRPL